MLEAKCKNAENGRMKTPLTARGLRRIACAASLWLAGCQQPAVVMWEPILTPDRSPLEEAGHAAVGDLKGRLAAALPTQGGLGCPSHIDPRRGGYALTKADVMMEEGSKVVCRLRVRRRDDRLASEAFRQGLANAIDRDTDWVVKTLNTQELELDIQHALGSTRDLLALQLKIYAHTAYPACTPAAPVARKLLTQEPVHLDEVRQAQKHLRTCQKNHLMEELVRTTTGARRADGWVALKEEG